MSFMLLCFMQSLVCAQEPDISNVIIMEKGNYLLIDIELINAFSERLDDAVEKGISVTFLFRVALYQIYDSWFDTKIKDLEMTNTLKYDNLTKEFMIHRSWDSNEQLTTKSYHDAHNLMSKIINARIASLAHLDKGKRYQIKIKANLQKMEIHPILQYFFFLFSKWGFETEWYLIDFVY